MHQIGAKGENKKMEEKAIHVRLDLYPGEPFREKFEDIKEKKGVVSNTEVLRLLSCRYHLRRRESHDR